MKKLLTYDLETTGLNPRTCRILGIAICISVGVAYYITLPKCIEKTKEILNSLKNYFEDPTIEKLGHNLKYDNQVLKNYEISVKGKIHDTMVSDYVLHPERKQHGLKLLSKLHLNYHQLEFDDVAIGKTKKDKTLEGVDPKLVTQYACEDVDQTLQLHQFLLPKIKNNNLDDIYNLDCQLVDVITDMEHTGVTIDTDLVKQIEHQIDSELKQLKTEVSKFTKGDFNINSTKDVNNLLFNQLSIEPLGDKNKNGLYSVSSKKLKRLLHQHDVIKLLLDYRALYKVKSTFIKALLQLDPVSGKLHTSINQTVTETGRLSSSKPNLQNIPSRTIGKRLRQCFIASSANHSLIGADFSNIELRVMAIISQDQTMLSAYKNGEDLHVLTASKVLGISYEQAKENKDQRNIGKLINFGLIYGMSAHGLRESLFLNARKDFTLEQCQDFINTYFDLYKGVAKCREDLIYKATINGYTETLFGRRRPLVDINSEDSYKRDAAKRLAMNTPIQGTAADIIKIAMVNIHKRLKSENLHSKMILQVHDELLFDVPNSELEYMEKLVKHEMENAVHLSIPMEVDLKSGKTWADVH